MFGRGDSQYRSVPRDMPTSSVTFGGARVARTFAGAVATSVALLIGGRIPASLPSILAVGLCVTVAIHILGVVQGLRGVRDEDASGNPYHPAHRDELTGLHNRKSLMSELELAVQETGRRDTVVGVMFLDLDRFKGVNDSMGHGVGDELLKIVAARLEGACRTSDVVGRFGGDEFVVICRGLLEHATVERVADTLHATFIRPITIDGSELLMSASIGVTSAGKGDERSAAELLRDADTAMYAAKNERSGVRVFDEHHRRAVVERMSVERELVPALSDDQFKVFYQPIVSWTGDTLSSLEALVRWEHPEYGLIGPDRFLPVVEDSGMMSRLGLTVLRESLAQKTVWNQRHSGMRDVSISVNVAERQLIDRNFPEQVAAAIEWAGLPASELTLEITENVMIERLDDSLSVLRELGDLGVSLAIDDFGTGRSSLAWVKQLDMIDAIKIDRSFIIGIPEGHVDMAIIDAIMLIAEALDLKVVAEGVETVEQAEALELLGVDLMQGYLFHRPAPASAIDSGQLIDVSATGRGSAAAIA
jgi:diguanylate cyclase (GGDEF)-like protein